MTNREYINQMTNKELAQCMVDMGKLCEQCYQLGDTYCDEGRASCQEKWLSKPYNGETDFDKFMKKRRTYLDLIDILSNTFDELGDKFPDCELVLRNEHISIKDIITFTDGDTNFNICARKD